MGNRKRLSRRVCTLGDEKKVAAIKNICSVNGNRPLNMMGGNVSRLQRALGNAAVGRLLKSGMMSGNQKICSLNDGGSLPYFLGTINTKPTPAGDVSNTIQGKGVISRQPDTTKEEAPKPTLPPQYNQASKVWKEAYLAAEKEEGNRKKARRFNKEMAARMEIIQKTGLANCNATSKAIVLIAEGVIPPKGLTRGNQYINALVRKAFPDAGNYSRRTSGGRDAQNFNRLKGSKLNKSKLAKTYEEDNRDAIDKMKDKDDPKRYSFKTIESPVKARERLLLGKVIVGYASTLIYNPRMHVTAYFYNPFNKKIYAQDPYYKLKPHEHRNHQYGVGVWGRHVKGGFEELVIINP